MSTAFVILWMIFFHIVDDYYLQGWLSSAKQKTWWEENAPDKKYKHDYKWALFMHGCSWAFMIMLPIAYVNNFAVGFEYIWFFVCNAIMHAEIDDLKANWKMTNLWQDQLLHMIQIAWTAIVLL